MERAINPPPPPQSRASKKRRTTAADKTISDLLDEIICDILASLPLKSIFRCKRVCKTWHNLLLEPYFFKLHHSRSPLSLILYRPSDRKNPSHFGVLEIDYLARFRRPNIAMKFRTEIDIPDSLIEIVGSSNGLLCLIDYSYTETVFVCNPIRGSYVILPKSPKAARQDSIPAYGFGYSPSTDEFKVFRFTITFNPAPRFDCHIYTLGNDDSWRSIGAAGQSYLPYNRNIVYLNGALHWIGKDYDSRFIICCFDIGKEQFGNLLLPSHIGVHSMSIGVVDNCLYVCDYEPSPPYVVNIWVMKDYGNSGSLSLEWVIEQPRARGLGGELEPVKILKDGSLLIIFNGKTLASYNPETRALRRIRYGGVRFRAEFVAHVPSFK